MGSDGTEARSFTVYVCPTCGEWSDRTRGGVGPYCGPDHRIADAVIAVPLEDVVEALREKAAQHNVRSAKAWYMRAADFIEERFGPRAS